MTTIAILLLAAGASSRMGGRDKLMEDVDGAPLLSRICHRAALTGLPCYVTVPGLSHPRVAATGTASVIDVPDASEGMAASIRTGVAALPHETDAVMILPCDMPDLETQDLLHLAAHFPSSNSKSRNSPVLRATASDGTPGHPVIFPRHCFAALRQITGDQGARAVLSENEVELVALPAQRALTDLDTPEAGSRWRASRGSHETENGRANSKD
ncbi:nucleotidyltransferase family protein [Pseudophaeobacter leonis]|uniref:nucleotidyltransferase family protein n=1 Tax=Pseudophaeobacter leonis TaxID=1144477 RepID=UPI0009F53529|nr:nucleotidyltransferase family protein [Pseudophaeobacter leonis]